MANNIGMATTAFIMEKALQPTLEGTLIAKLLTTCNIKIYISVTKIDHWG